MKILLILLLTTLPVYAQEYDNVVQRCVDSIANYNRVNEAIFCKRSALVLRETAYQYPRKLYHGVLLEESLSWWHSAEGYQEFEPNRARLEINEALIIINNLILEQPHNRELYEMRRAMQAFRDKIQS
jgi:hypothetical protein